MIAALSVLGFNFFNSTNSFKLCGFSKALAITLSDAFLYILLEAVNNLPNKVNCPSLALIISENALPKTPSAALDGDFLPKFVMLYLTYLNYL